MLLYKYRTFEHLEYLLDILVNHRLYCSEYKSLNDPFEGMFLETYDPGSSLSFGLASSFDFGFVPGRQRVRRRSVEDPVTSAVRKRVCSLSASASDVRLWSLYANGHSGVAVEIDFGEHLGDVHEVKYVKELPERAMFRGLLATSSDKWDPVEVFRLKRQD